jgi:hypothetical protein
MDSAGGCMSYAARIIYGQTLFAVCASLAAIWLVLSALNYAFITLGPLPVDPVALDYDTDPWAYEDMVPIPNHGTYVWELQGGQI